MRYIKPIYNDLDFFDNGFDEFFKPMSPKEVMMKTDVYEKEGNIVLEMEVPGFKKENINIELEDGYLTITASKQTENDVKEGKHDKYIRKERYTGTCSRKFYVGDIDASDIKANFADGVLSLVFPKESEKPETKKKICID